MSELIIAALDPERKDEAPLILAAALARVTEAPLLALAAYLHDPITSAVTSGTVDAELRVDALSRLEALTSGTDADLLVMGGASPAHVLQEAATRLGASILVVGSTGKGPLGRLAPGSTAERVLHRASCAVAVATKGLASDWAPRRIGVGFVDSDDGRRALRAAAALAEAGGGTLLARTVVDPLAWRRSTVIEPYDLAGGLERSRTAAQRALDRAIAELPAGVRVSGDVVVGQPSGELAVLSRDVDLLVCGSHGYGPLRAVMLGGVTHPLIHKAHCPLLIVPRGDEKPLASTDAGRRMPDAARRKLRR